MATVWSHDCLRGCIDRYFLHLYASPEEMLPLKLDSSGQILNIVGGMANE